MKHLPKTQPTQAGKFGNDTLLIAGLFIVGGFLLFAAFIHHHNSKGLRAANVMAQNGNGQQRSPASAALGTFNKQLAPRYRIHFKTISLDSFDKDKHFPAEAALVVDGRQVFSAKQARFFDRYLELSRGTHSVVIKMWDNRHKVTEKKYQVNVGVKPAGKVARR